MTEREYIQRLRENLRQIPETETEDVVEYVREYFEEAGEEETLRALGCPADQCRRCCQTAAASGHCQPEAAESGNCRRIRLLRFRPERNR